MGITLTSEQVAALTHDIVWLENATINDQQVLVPVLYLAQANNRLAPNGALIAGNDVNLIAGKDLNNVGTLRATENLLASAGNNLVNSGLIDAGNRLDLLTGNNLSNKAGGIIAGRDISLTASGGDVLNERTVTSHNSSNGYRTERTDFVDNAARIEAANSLSLQAGRDVNSIGSLIKSGADTTIKAGRDVNLVASEQRKSQIAGTLFRGDSTTQYGSVTITVRNPDGANDLAGLNRDTANANQHLDRPDEKAMQERIDLIQSSAQLSSSVINTVAKAKADAAAKLANEATTPEQKQAAVIALEDAKSWQVGGDKRLMADIASGLIAAGLGGATGSTAVGIVANTSSNEIFNKIGDFATEQRDKATDSAVKAAWGEGGAARILLHALAGAAIGLSSGSAQSGALGAVASAALMPSIGQALAGSGLSKKEQDVVASLIATGVGTAARSVNGAGGAVVAGGAGFGVEAFNRQLHKQQEVPVLEKKAEELYKTLGMPRSSALWLDLLMIAAGGAVDAADEARLNGLVLQSKGNDPESRNFTDDLSVAKGIVAQLAAQKIPLNWSDGSQIIANGEKVFAFRATEKQFNDSTLFNTSVLHGQGVVYDQWRQYGQEQTGEHSKEIGQLSSSESSIKAATQRLSDLAGKGITTIAPELDAAMLLMPVGQGAKVVVEAILAKVAAGKAAGVGAKGEVSGLLPKPGATSIPASGLGAGAAFKVDSKQLGKKLGKHVEDFGGNAASPADRKMVLDKIHDVGSNPEKVIPGTFAGQGANGARGDVFFRVKGNDVVVTKPDGTFVTILKDGVTQNPSVQSALKGGVR